MGSAPSTFGTPAGALKWTTGQRASRATACNRRSGLTAVACPTAAEQRNVVHAVGIGPALAEVDAFAPGPLPHRLQLADRPHEAARDGAAVALHPLAIDVGGVPGGDEMVEAQPSGQRLDQVVGGRGRQHQHPAGQAVRGEQGRNVREDLGLQPIGSGFGGLAHLRHRPAPYGQGRSPGRGHRGQGLAEHVVEPHQQILARQAGSTGQPVLVESLVDRRRTRAPQEGPVEVEDRRGSGHSRRPYRLSGGPEIARPPADQTIRNLSNRSERTVVSVVLMDFRQLQALIAIADHGSFSAAATALQTVQSNVSSHVARLERELGVQLVDRHGGQLTEEGQAVVERGRRVAAELEAAVADVAALRHEVSGTARIGMIGTTARWLAPLLLDGMDRAHPKVRLVVGDGTSATLEPLLASGSLDAAIVNLPQSSPDLVERPLFDEDLVLVVPSDHAFAERRQLPLKELDGFELLLPAPGTTFRLEIDEACRTAGIALTAPRRAGRGPPHRLAHPAGLRAGDPAGHRGRSRR